MAGRRGADARRALGRAGFLPGLADFAAELDQRFRARWPNVEPMPLYPAFA